MRNTEQTLPRPSQTLTRCCCRPVDWTQIWNPFRSWQLPVLWGKHSLQKQAGKTWENEPAAWPILLQTHWALPTPWCAAAPSTGWRQIALPESILWYLVQPCLDFAFSEQERSSPWHKKEHRGQHRASLSATATENPASIPATTSHLKDLTYGPPVKISTKLLITPWTKEHHQDYTISSDEQIKTQWGRLLQASVFEAYVHMKILMKD